MQENGTRAVKDKSKKRQESKGQFYTGCQLILHQRALNVEGTTEAALGWPVRQQIKKAINERLGGMGQDSNGTFDHQKLEFKL